MFQPIRGQGGHLVFPIGPKRKLGRGCWDLAPCQFSLIVQRRSRKRLSQSETRAAILFFWSAQKTQTWKRTLISGFLLSFVEFRSAVSEEKSKMNQPIRGQAIGPKNINLIEDVESLLPVKFHWLLFIVFRVEVKHVSASQKPGDHLVFIRPSSDGTYYGMVMSVRPGLRPSVRPSVRHSFPHFSPTCFDILIWNFVYHFFFMHIRSSSNAINFRHFLQELCSFSTSNSYKYTVFRTFLLHALTYWVQILYMTLF